MSNESGLRPMEHNLIVRMDAVEEVRPSGLVIPQQKLDRLEVEADEGVIVAVAEHALSYAKDWRDAPPQVGDRVLMAQFDGRIWKRNGITYRIIKDKSVIAVVEQTAPLAAAA